MKTSVYKDAQGDWVMECREHFERVYCCSQDDAYEAAVGHVVMHHPSKRECEHCGTKYVVSVGCWWCR